jgi:hypothetical protein
MAVAADVDTTPYDHTDPQPLTSWRSKIKDPLSTPLTCADASQMCWVCHHLSDRPLIMINPQAAARLHKAAETR